jgi:uncharacterized protein YhjY with autotransporter beta-barrel domain
VKNDRNIPNALATASGGYNMYWLQAGLAAGYDFQAGENTVISSSLGLAWLGSRSQGFTEKGAGSLNLDVDSQDMNSLKIQAYTEARTGISTAGGLAVTPPAPAGPGL